jgi:hypothetical protein
MVLHIWCYIYVYTYMPGRTNHVGCVSSICCRATSVNLGFSQSPANMHGIVDTQQRRNVANNNTDGLTLAAATEARRTFTLLVGERVTDRITCYRHIATHGVYIRT